MANNMTDCEADRSKMTELLEKFRESRCLWDTTCEEYSNREARYGALTTLLEIYKQINPNATLVSLRRKLENMRTAYKRELRKVRDSICSGVEEQIYTPRLWYYDLLSFLDERNINTRDGTDMIQEDDFAINDSYMESQEMRHISKRKREEQKNREELITLTKKLITSKPDQWDGLAIAYTEQLRELQPQQQAIAQKLISEVICFGKLGLLSTQSTVILPAQPHSFPVIQTSVVPVPSTPPVTHIPTLAPVPSPSPVSHILSSSSTNTQPSPCLSSTINTYNRE